VLTAVDGGAEWKAVPYAICYVVTVNDKPVTFPTGTSISGLKVGDVVTVQSVNEYGALSEMSQAVQVAEATGIETVNRESGASVEAVYTIDGKRIPQMQRGLNIIRMSDGTTRKVTVK
jgi:hypothetical protein